MDDLTFEALIAIVNRETADFDNTVKYWGASEEGPPDVNAALLQAEIDRRIKSDQPMSDTEKF